MKPIDLRFSILGRTEVASMTAGMKVSMRNRVLRGAITKGTRIVARAAKDLAPRGKTGILGKSIGTKVVTRRRVVGLAGVRMGFRQVVDGETVDPAKYGHFAEAGRKEVVVKNKRVLAGHGQIFGKRVRAAQGSRFLAHSYMRTRAEVTELVRVEIAARAYKALS